jgi:hypothetical protein
MGWVAFASLLAACGSGRRTTRPGPSDAGLDASWLVRSASGWTQETIATGLTDGRGDPSIAIDATGVPHVVYSKPDSGFEPRLLVIHAWRAPDDVDRDCDGARG